VFTKLTTVGTLNAANFKIIGSAALDADDYILYDKTTGALSYDADGSGAGAAVRVAVLGTNLALTNADFIVT
jgi:Ca2+-binding RTX toxin-like protein